MEHERVPLSLADPAGAGPQVPAQGVPGRALLHDPLQHLSDPAGHIYTGLRRAPVPQQLYVGSKETYNFNFKPRCVVRPSSKCWCRPRDSWKDFDLRGTFSIVFALNVLVETNTPQKTQLSLPLMTALSAIEVGTSRQLKSQPRFP